MIAEEKLKILRTLFNEVDPQGIFFDENEDEYDPEIEELISSLPDFADLNHIEENLKRIFSKFFEGIKLDYASLKKLAKKIHEKLGDPATKK